MPKFRQVHVWPDTGFAERPWNDDPDVDAFARISRGICEAYSQALPGLALVARASVMRLDADPDASRRPRPALDAPLSDMVKVSARFIGAGQEHGWVGVPVGFATLPTDQKRLLSLRIVHHGVLELAQALGWDPGVVTGALHHVEARAFRYWSEGPWKSAPDRRHRARAVASISDDGLGHVHVEVVTAAGELIIRSEDFDAADHGDDLVRACKALRWDGSARVSMDPFGITWTDQYRQTVIDLYGGQTGVPHSAPR
ncbi:hypothetical protein [Actinoplanes sp. NPDC049316]|uniref:hypothetical protein n=1 Tax=Actinoplanes sp. NPDC049316 TaxID=3154727 RepID=UPI00343058A5